ncbi:hypothetical protein LG293_17695 (plasmid) [Citricoccus nitrophenolicus]
MTDLSSSRRRQPKGVSTGGQFAPDQKSEAPISLASRRAGHDTKTGFIAANPVPGHQGVSLDFKKVYGQATEVLTYTSGDGAKVMVLPHNEDPTTGKVLNGMRIDRQLYGTTCSGTDTLVRNILVRQESQRQTAAVKAAGIPAKGKDFSLAVTHREENGAWRLYLRPVDADPRSEEGSFEIIHHPTDPQRTGMRTTDGARLTKPLTGGADLDRTVASLTGMAGDSAQEFFTRAESRYQKARSKTGL